MIDVWLAFHCTLNIVHPIIFFVLLLSEIAIKLALIKLFGKISVDNRLCELRANFMISVGTGDEIDC